MLLKLKKNWLNVLFLTLTPILGIGGSVLYLTQRGFLWEDWLVFLALYLLSGLSITAGYHRYFAHRTHETHPLLQIFYLLLGAAAFENSALNWSADHRCHHRYTDQDRDPYNIRKGFFWAHMGWIFYETKVDPDFETVPDLLTNRWVMWQHKYYLLISVVVSFVVPTLIGALYGSALGGFLIGGLLRVVFVHHGTFLINSAAHMFGSQPYSDKNSSRDNWSLAFFTFGEGYHNFHHTFPNDYRNGARFYQWDPTKWWIQTMNFLGFTRRLHRVKDWAILQARYKMAYRQGRLLIEQYPAQLRATFRRQLDTMNVQLQESLLQWANVRTKFSKLSLKKQYREYQHFLKQLPLRPMPST